MNNKYALFLILANVLMKIFIGIGIWKLAMDIKSINDVQTSVKYDEEPIVEAEHNYYNGQNSNFVQEQIY